MYFLFHRDDNQNTRKTIELNQTEKMYSYSELQFLYNHQNHIYKCICICLGAATMELSNIWPRQPRCTQEARDYHHRTNKAQIGNKLKKHEGRYDNIIILMCCFLFFRLWRQHVTALNDKNDYLKKKNNQEHVMMKKGTIKVSLVRMGSACGRGKSCLNDNNNHWLGRK